MKIVIYCDTGWSLGQLYSAVAPHVGAELVDWAVSRPKEYFRDCDRVITLAGPGSSCLVDVYGVPREKIIVVAHADEDLIALSRHDNGEQISRYAGLGVVSDTLACTSLSIGITRVPVVLRQGIDCARYAAPPSERLRTVGYGAVLSRKNFYGVEIKRGELVRRAAELAGLKFVSAVGLSREQMPGYYASVDAVVCSSLQEGGAMPPYEAAAAGRLVYGTPVGDFPRLAYEGMGILLPLNDGQLVAELVDSMSYYRRMRRCFQLKCSSIRQAAQVRDWSRVVGDWVGFIRKAGG